MKVDDSGRERIWRMGVRGGLWCKYCVHINANAKNIPIETIFQLAE
jgi:hypothetical protein